MLVTYAFCTGGARCSARGRNMNGKAWMAVAVAAVVIISSAGAFLLLGRNDDGGGERTITAAVYFDDGTGDPYCGQGSGGDTVSIIRSAAGNTDVQFNSNGSVRSVDGRTAGTDERWVVWRWASPAGWTPFSGIDISSLPHDVSLAVSLSGMTMSEGVVSYEPPDIKVEYRIYFFIQMREQYSANDWIRSTMGTEQDRRDGQWFSAAGSNVMEAFEKIVWGELFTGAYTEEQKKEILNYRIEPSQFGWLDMFMGWTDTLIGGGVEEGTWTYWSQYNWTGNGGWEYNNLSLGRYDITDHRYFSLILQTTAAHDTDDKFPQTYPNGIPEGI